VNKLSPDYFFELASYRHNEIFSGLTYVWEALPKISAYLKNSPLGIISGEVHPGAYLINPESISIGKGTIVEPGAYIKGPCIVGENCTVRHGAYIRGDVITGDRCVIGHDSELKNTILLDGAHAAHFAYVGDSILGNGVNLGAGTKFANLKLIRSTVIVHVDGKKFNTFLDKFGAILGDHCQIGCNAVANPGTLMGKNSICYPCVNFGGFVDAEYTVKNNTHLILTPSSKPECGCKSSHCSTAKPRN
jgi:NDP-sugar pyrophosphorylase family protein